VSNSGAVGTLSAVTYARLHLFLKKTLTPLSPMPYNHRHARSTYRSLEANAVLRGSKAPALRRDGSQLRGSGHSRGASPMDLPYPQRSHPQAIALQTWYGVKTFVHMHDGTGSPVKVRWRAWQRERSETLSIQNLFSFFFKGSSFSFPVCHLHGSRGGSVISRRARYLRPPLLSKPQNFNNYASPGVPWIQENCSTNYEASLKPAPTVSDRSRRMTSYQTKAASGPATSA